MRSLKIGQGVLNNTAIEPISREYSQCWLCVFLISDLARYVSGAYIPVDGGNSPQMGG